MVEKQETESESERIAELMAPIELLQPVLERKWMVLLITIVTTAIFFFGSYFFSKYRSDAVFQFGGAIPAPERQLDEKKVERFHDGENKEEKVPALGIDLANFKRYAAAYSTDERFTEYLRSEAEQPGADVEGLHRVFSSAKALSRIIEPIYAFMKSDSAVLLGQLEDVKANNVIALHLSYEADSPERALKTVGLLGNYVINSLIYFIYLDTVKPKRDEIKIKMTLLENSVINDRIKLSEYGKKIAELKKIMASSPQTDHRQERQVVTITRESALYLPPETQLTAAEVMVADLNQSIKNANRELLQDRLLLQYYEKLESVVQKNQSGVQVLKDLEPLKEDTFKGKNLDDDVIRQVYNLISAENQTALNLYLNKSRFIAGPTLPSSPTVKRSTFAIVGFLIGLLIAIIAALASHRRHRVEA